MGQRLAKEWKAVNESEPIGAEYENRELDVSTGSTSKSTPVNNAPQHDRLRVLKEDPRSPSGSISRTPIEVVATPNRAGGEFSPAPSPAVGDSPGVGLLKKSGDFQRKYFQRNAPPKFQAFENDCSDEMAD